MNMFKRARAQTTHYSFFIWTALAVGLIYLLAPVLTPFLTAALLAYLFNPIVNHIEKWRLPRLTGVIFVFILIICALLLLLFLLIPLLERQIAFLLSSIPQIEAWILSVFLPWLNQYLSTAHIAALKDWPSFIAAHWREGGNVVLQLWKTVSQSGLTIAAFIMNLFLVPVVLFYLLRDWNKIITNFKKWIPDKNRKTVVTLIEDCGKVLSAFFRGQLLVMIALGLIYGLGLWLVGLNIGLLIGVIAGLLSIVPYLGFAVGFIIALLAAFFQFHDITHLLYIVIVFLIGQSAEGWVLTPWLVGRRVGLHPIAVIFAILAFGQLFGFLGVLLAVPVFAVLFVLLKYIRTKY